MRRNYTLSRSQHQNQDLVCSESQGKHLLKYNNSTVVAPSCELMSHVLCSFPNLSNERLLEMPPPSTVTAFFDNEDIMKDVQATYRHLGDTIRFKTYNSPDQLQRCLAYTSNQKSLVFCKIPPPKQLLQAMK